MILLCACRKLMVTTILRHYIRCSLLMLVMVSNCYGTQQKAFLTRGLLQRYMFWASKFRNKLLEVIDASQLPDFLGGTCSCPNEGGCLRSNKGPWNDPEIMKLVHSGEAIYLRKVTSFSDGEDLEVKSLSSKVSSNEISYAEVGSDVGLGSSGFMKLKPHCNKERPSDPASIRSLVEPVGSASRVEDASSTNDMTNNVTQRRPLKTLIPQVTSFVVHFILKLLACIYLVLPGLRRIFAVKHVDKQLQSECRPKLKELNSQEQHTLPAIEEAELHPCWQRLQHLEGLVTDLFNKPTRIPPEKEDMLLDSLSRIKSIEYDLQKTKKALLATASKQVELAESLEGLKANGTNSCWLRNCKSFPPGR
ncbi:hypothetical protein L1049_003649 [Liquidambar formosana]|uniref:Uncharacterized protein n=1 Tax=Liquidambar formosana TaxID=63359 RepID=A0AAP0RM04_LIQFO